jgi:PKD repeat protein
MTLFSFTPTLPLNSDPVTFTATFTPSDATRPVTYTWDYGGDGTQVTAVQSASHAFSRPGTFVVRLSTTNGYGLPAVYTKTVIVDGRPLSGVSIGAPAWRPFGVAPSSLPIEIVLAHENNPGIIMNPASVGFSLTRLVKVCEMRTA